MFHRIKSLTVVKERQKRYAVTVRFLSTILVIAVIQLLLLRNPDCFLSRRELLAKYS